MVAEYTVAGMSCDHCVRTVSAELLALQGVSDVTVDLSTGLVRVTSDGTLTTGTISAAIHEAGYELAGAVAN
jgi:copper chaperone